MGSIFDTEVRERMYFIFSKPLGGRYMEVSSIFPTFDRIFYFRPPAPEGDFFLDCKLQDRDDSFPG